MGQRHRGDAKGRVLLVVHAPGPRIDRVSQRIAERGYEVRWWHSYRGDPIPGPEDGYEAMVVYGGAQSANDSGSLDFLAQEIRSIEAWVKAEKPFLGICLGGQLLCRALGGSVAPHPEGCWEVGYEPIEATEAGAGLFPETLHVYHWHKEGFSLPHGCELLAAGETFPNQAFRYGPSAFGLQFHPEVTPAIMCRWTEQAAHCLAEPGAQPATKQFCDARRYHAPLGDWLDGFLDRWLE
ncbi:MAG: gamma-glutamyl-gamma-aminobutyrate hydrolase family protein [Rhodovibrionaceae bacterium]